VRQATRRFLPLILRAHNAVKTEAGGAAKNERSTVAGKPMRPECPQPCFIAVRT